MRCYSPKFLSLPLVFRRGVGEYDLFRASGPLLNHRTVSSSLVRKRMPNALCASYRNRFCSAALSLSVRLVSSLHSG